MGIKFVDVASPPAAVKDAAQPEEPPAPAPPAPVPPAPATPAAKRGKAKAGNPPNPLKRPSPALAAIVGTKPIARTEVVASLWAYIKSKELQDPANGKVIICDVTMKGIFGHDRITMFEMNSMVGEHLK